MIEILTIGDELTSGSIADENSRFIAESLYSTGLPVSRITTVGDGVEDIETALKNTLKESCFVIVTGGLGPTDDDRTAHAAGKTFNRKLLLNREAVETLENIFHGLKRKMPAAAKKQAMLPEGCRIIPNPAGTACAFLIEEKKKQFIFLPGVPSEVRAINKSFLAVYLKNAINTKQVIIVRTLKIFGLWESEIQERLKGVLPETSAVQFSYYPSYPEVRLKITGLGNSTKKVLNAVNGVLKIVHSEIGEHVYSDNDELLEKVVGDMLKKRGATLAIAESCTGGLITHRLTNLPGSSSYLERAMIVYSNRAKEDMLKVSGNIINKHGAVSEPVARQMAEQVRNISGTTYGIAVTGIAGPAGGTEEKPVGTVFIAVSSRSKTEVKKFLFHGSRNRIKMISSHSALDLLRRIIFEESAPA